MKKFIEKVGEMCIELFAYLLSFIAPEFCIRYLTVKTWKNGKKNVFAWDFLPKNCIVQAKVARKLSKKELGERVWLPQAVSLILTQPDRDFTADELLKIYCWGADKGLSLPFRYALYEVERHLFLRKRSFTHENYRYSLDEVPNLIKAVLPVMDDKRMGIEQEDYDKWLFFACAYMPDIYFFLQKSEACKYQLENNSRWSVLKKTLDNYLKFESGESKMEEVMEQIAELPADKQKKMLQAVLHSLWYGDESLYHGINAYPVVATKILEEI